MIRTISIFLLLTGIAGAVNSDRTRLSPLLNQVFSSPVIPDSVVSVVIFFDNEGQKRAQAQAAAVPVSTRTASIKRALHLLPAASEIDSRLLDRIRHEATDSIIQFWITPAIQASLPLSIVALLSNDPSIRLIIPNATLELISPTRTDPASSAASVSSELQLLRVPELWRTGITGKGRLVCSFDTGVESSHPALSSKWRGRHANLSASWYSSIRPDTLPFDRVGHGSHTMGIMVGTAGADSFGVAPGAEWISAGVIDQGRPLNTTVGDILAAFQWALNPDGDTATTDDVPDVILNSWGIPAGLFGACDPTFWDAIDNVEAAGIVTIFAAGNEGPNPQTLRDPADRPSSPTNSFSVGAIDNNRIVTSFSSRGPSRCNPQVVKPELVAPGMQIRSCTKGGGYAVMSGTSMAAPYIAGLVALCREINPDATVEQIKSALLLSATDLGETGDDNAYGHGLVDATLLPDFVSQTPTYAFELNSISISSPGTVLPGQIASVRPTISNLFGNTSTVTGRLITSFDAATISQAASGYIFGTGGTVSTSAVPYEITVDSSVPHGTIVPFALILQEGDGTPLDTLSFEIAVGYPSPGATAVQSTGSLSLELSDFGQLGCAPGSAYNLGKSGLVFEGSGNLLYECGLIVGRSRIQLSSAVRGSSGAYVPSDFTPISSIGNAWTDPQGGTRRTAVYADTYTDVSIPVRIKQESISFQHAEDRGFIIIRYRIYNNSLAPLTELHAGLLLDIDLPSGETIVRDSQERLTYFVANGQPIVGLVELSGTSGATVLGNGLSKRGLDKRAQFELISAAADSNLIGEIADPFVVTASPAYALQPGDSVDLVFAIVAAGSVAELYDAVTQSRQKYDIATEIESDIVELPNGYSLGQNFPNPFNPETVIPFSLATTQTVRLELFNLLGQLVSVPVDGVLPAGSHELVWNATNQSGAEVASGVYFYRLTTEQGTSSKKMLLVR